MSSFKSAAIKLSDEIQIEWQIHKLPPIKNKRRQLRKFKTQDEKSKKLLCRWMQSYRDRGGLM